MRVPAGVAVFSEALVQPLRPLGYGEKGVTDNM